VGVAGRVARGAQNRNDALVESIGAETMRCIDRVRNHWGRGGVGSEPLVPVGA
jgi:hypothetical protein